MARHPFPADSSSSTQWLREAVRRNMQPHLRKWVSEVEGSLLQSLSWSPSFAMCSALSTTNALAQTALSLALPLEVCRVITIACLF